MIRDILKDKAYFESFIQNTLAKKEAFIANINTLPDPQEEFIKNSATLEQLTRDILIGRYSAGVDIDHLLSDYEETVLWFGMAYNNPETFYIPLLWLISIGIMIEENKWIDKIKKLVERNNPQDSLIDFLLEKNIPQSSLNLLYPIPYKGILEVIEISRSDKQKAVERLKIYLQNEWYNGHAECSWYDSHKSNKNTYAGYWSFESGAVVKLLDLDDTILRDIPYYPYDMAHWK